MGRFVVCFAMLMALSTPAQAKRLYSVWTLQPTSEVGERAAEFGEVLLEQRLVPLKAVELSEDATTDGGKITAAGTALFMVAQEDGQRAFCTAKDRSTKNAAKSLFIPALDKRPCFVDADGDGKFDGSFNVFDKYGSALAPSGKLRKARPLASAAAYRVIEPSEYPSNFRLTYRLYGKRDIMKAKVDVGFDNGSGKAESGSARSERDGNVLTTMNAAFRFMSIEDRTAKVSISTDDEAFLVGTSSGSFAIFETPPPFIGD